MQPFGTDKRGAEDKGELVQKSGPSLSWKLDLPGQCHLFWINKLEGRFAICDDTRFRWVTLSAPGQLCEGGGSGPLRKHRAYLEGQGFASA